MQNCNIVDHHGLVYEDNYINVNDKIQVVSKVRLIINNLFINNILIKRLDRLNARPIYLLSLFLLCLTILIKYLRYFDIYHDSLKKLL